MKIVITEKQAKKLHSRSVICDKCEHEWVVEDKDSHPDLCHDCGWDNVKKVYDKENFHKFWKKEMNEKWSEKYKKSIDCKNPKCFSQRAHCQGRKKNN